MEMQNAELKFEISEWPADEGIWMAKLPGDLDWFPLQTMALKDDLPSEEQLRLEAEDPANALPRRTLAIVAQWPESETNWPYTFKSCHPVKEWRRPTPDELVRARHFYGLDVRAGTEATGGTQ